MQRLWLGIFTIYGFDYSQDPVTLFETWKKTEPVKSKIEFLEKRGRYEMQLKSAKDYETDRIKSNYWAFVDDETAFWFRIRFG